MQAEHTRSLARKEERRLVAFAGCPRGGHLRIIVCSKANRSWGIMS
jgi:hypothetical protein